MKTRLTITLFVAASLATMGFSLTPEKDSELAKLMKQMMEFIKNEKANLEAGKAATMYPKSFDKVRTAKVTPGKQLSSEHTKYADDFITALSFYYKAETLEERKGKFNNVVYTCITCHKEECPGPISSIRLNLVK